jgi:hypothetical protein
MAKGLEKWNVDRTVGEQYFQQALDDYRAASKASSEPFTRGRAMFGVAQSLEGLGERKESILEYKRLVTEGVSEDIVAESKRRLNWLEGRDAETFFAWYRERSDTAPAPIGASGLPNIPGLPDFNIPGLPDFAFPPASETSAPKP